MTDKPEELRRARRRREAMIRRGLLPGNMVKKEAEDGR